MERGTFLGTVVAVLVVATTAATLVAAAQDPYLPRPPILIRGDADFTEANGVRAGRGLPEDPFVIEGWDLDASWSTGISVQDTQAWFVIRGVRVRSGGALFDAVYLHNASHARLESLRLEGNRVGVHLDRTEDVVVANSEILGNRGNGISVLSSSNLVLRENRIADNAIGIWLYGSVNASVASNNVSSGTDAGIYLHGSHDVRVTDNEVSLDVYGIYLFDSNGVEVVGNRARGNAETGIGLLYAQNVTIEGNEAEGNDFGIFLYGSSSATISDNEILRNLFGVLLHDTADVSVYGNSIVDNGRQAVDDNGTRVRWDRGYLLGGNYWSDYQEADLCSGPEQNLCPLPDGVGDQPYVIDENSADRYPLVEAGVDTYPPVVSIVHPENGSLVHETPLLVSGTASDPVGHVFRVEVRVNEGPWEVAEGTTAWAFQADILLGTNRIEVRAWDRTGNPSVVVYVLVSREPLPNRPPTAAFAVIPESAQVGVLVSVDATESSDPEDGAQGLEVRWDWEADGSWDTAWSFSRAAAHGYDAPGTYTIRIEVRDSEGASATADRQVTIHEPPVLGGSSVPFAVAATAAGIAAVFLFRQAVRMRRRRAARRARDRTRTWDEALRRIR